MKYSQNDWYDYIYSKSIITDSTATVIPLINQFKERFPNEDPKIIDELENRIEIGSQSYQFILFVIQLLEMIILKKRII